MKTRARGDEKRWPSLLLAGVLVEVVVAAVRVLDVVEVRDEVPRIRLSAWGSENERFTGTHCLRR